ncbi:hypothetical protein RRG08_014379 [Elysia crispata]|uniref:Uncharacterized protein n=1 Tax=Elysia crispata TaxID=231223 RepID=A0AAE0YN42_9GAST|nr:hypothetical protein RRG08_014379 [Elysia crispata]
MLDMNSLKHRDIFSPLLHQLISRIQAAKTNTCCAAYRLLHVSTSTINCTARAGRSLGTQSRRPHRADLPVGFISQKCPQFDTDGGGTLVGRDFWFFLERRERKEGMKDGWARGEEMRHGDRGFMVT